MFKKIRQSLNKTRRQIAAAVGTGDITEETWEDMEDTLVRSDLGVETTIELVDAVRERAEAASILYAQDLTPILKSEMRKRLESSAEFAIGQRRQLTVVMVVGVNGSGKTTSIGKMAHYYKDDFNVRLAAGDTFRAGAIDQLKIWAERAGVPITASQPGSDAAALIYDSIRAARARDVDPGRRMALLFVDTAGRLQTNFNLMRELEKVYNVCATSVHEAPHETLIVIDAPTGQNALEQAKKFKESVNLTGVILTKLDGTGKGGMIFSIYRELGIPVRFVGTGEAIDDLVPFDADAFVNGMFDE